MRSLFFVLSILMVMGLAFWAYNENYQTQQALKETKTLQREIAATRGRLAHLRSEWAYLRRPDRLRLLVEANFDTLGLLPLLPEQFGSVRQVGYPIEDLGPIVEPIDVIGSLELDQ